MQLAPTAPTTPSHSLAEAYVRDASWLLAPKSAVLSLDPIDSRTVRVLVADPFTTDPHDQVEADRLVADSAATVLEQAAHGVRLVVSTRMGYIGHLRELAPAQMTFLTGLPGVQRYDLQPEDLDGDGRLAPGELAHHLDVDTAADQQRLDWLLRDHFDEGTVHDGPVTFSVPDQPFRFAPVAGAR